MIRLTENYNRHAVSLAASAILSVTEASVSSQWHGTRAIVRTTDGRTLEVCETHDEIVAAVARDLCVPGYDIP